MNDVSSTTMSSNRPYLLRAIYDWITDNGLTPYILVDATHKGVNVPRQTVKQGQVLLNLAMHAVARLELGNEWIHFHARFSGISHQVTIPIQAVLALYAQENGQGMIFGSEDGNSTPPPDDTPPSSPETGEGERKKAARDGVRLRVVK